MNPKKSPQARVRALAHDSRWCPAERLKQLVDSLELGMASDTNPDWDLPAQEQELEQELGQDEQQEQEQPSQRENRLASGMGLDRHLDQRLARLCPARQEPQGWALPPEQTLC